MSEETKKTAQELEECDLDAVAGGSVIVIKREPAGETAVEAIQRGKERPAHGGNRGIFSQPR